MTSNESQARSQLIDPRLRAADWRIDDRSQVGFEIPVDGYDAEPWNGVTDYCLFDASGDVLAVVEAKRCSRDSREGEEQLRQYVAGIARNQSFAPFGFMSNGLSHFFWEVGLSHPREVASFFTPDDLERLKFIRDNRQPLADTAIKNAIVDRAYQHEAIRRVAEAFTAGRRRALLVMATGTGKTRTTMGLIDVFMRSSWAQTILFLADRDELVKQALEDGFQTYLPHEPRVRIRTASIDKGVRLYVATQQTMGRCFEQFSPGFFDLIVFDEAHRSIFNRFTEVIEYFDARMVGLTATPADFIGRDTFQVFGCHDQTPTFLYTYPTAVAEKRLVDFRLYQAQTGFQRDGIQGADLSEEDRNVLIASGIDPDTLDYSGTDIEVVVSNEDTLRRQWEEVMEVCIKDQGGNLPGKTIVFAMTKKHAKRIRDVFEEMYPEQVGMLQVIHHGVERVHDGPSGDGLITKFKKQDKPRIAVSVDMLDTGIDVPEVVNLVFMKPVQSRIKLWQMIGRGTRNQQACRFFDRLPNGEKTEFLIVDFWQNDFGRQADEPISAELPLLVKLFNTRLDILEVTLGDRDGIAHLQAIGDCRAMLGRVPTESFSIRRRWAEVASAWTDDLWSHLEQVQLDFLRLNVAPLLRFVPDVDIAAETFTHKVERLNLMILMLSPTATELPQPMVRLLESIGKDVRRLPQDVLQKPDYQSSITLAMSSELARATPPQLKQLIDDLAKEMKRRREVENPFLNIDLPDFIATKGHLLIGPTGQPVHVEEYRRRVEERIVGIADTHPALTVLRDGGQPTDEQLVDLERVLQHELAEGDLYVSAKTARQAYGLNLDNRLGFLGFVRHVLALEAIPDYEAVVAGGFQTHVTNHNYNADQIRFLRAVQEVFLNKRRLSEADLYDPPLTLFGRNAVERFFTPEQIQELLKLAESLAA